MYETTLKVYIESLCCRNHFTYTLDSLHSHYMSKIERKTIVAIFLFHISLRQLSIHYRFICIYQSL